ncbi:MAG: GNAT family N-acetyltransferase [Treponema sp.]|nr:GNAT family N-acetyltransferase [Treponema sp.]
MQILSIEAEEFQHQFTVSEINKMQIISVNERTFSLAQSYLLPVEQKCVFLSQLVRKHSPDIYIILDKNPDNSNNSDKSSQLINLQNVLGVFYLNKSLFHCFKDTSKVNIADFTPLFYQILTQNQASIKNISGEKDGTDFFLEVIRNLSENPDSTFPKKINIKQINDYKLMVLPHQQFQQSQNQSNHQNNQSLQSEPLKYSSNFKSSAQKLYNDDFIMRCTENDMENLFEIERNYLQDEVAVRGQKVSDAEVSMRLRQILKNQLYFALISDDRIVSKAYTNAIGKNWIQIGGVYTLFQFRQNGYAALTVSTLCKRILQAHKNISLFVKTKNLPAQQLYQKIGFTFHSDYKIVYFE